MPWLFGYRGLTSEMKKQKKKVQPWREGMREKKKKKKRLFQKEEKVTASIFSV